MIVAVECSFSVPVTNVRPDQRGATTSFTVARPRHCSDVHIPPQRRSCDWIGSRRADHSAGHRRQAALFLFKRGERFRDDCSKRTRTQSHAFEKIDPCARWRPLATRRTWDTPAINPQPSKPVPPWLQREGGQVRSRRSSSTLAGCPLVDAKEPADRKENCNCDKRGRRAGKYHPRGYLRGTKVLELIAHRVTSPPADL
jgi:hypothetical protein